MCKPFLTIDQQIGLLESRGVATDAETASILMREGYYSVVNGYKAPFLDDEKTLEAGPADSLDWQPTGAAPPAGRTPRPRARRLLQTTR